MAKRYFCVHGHFYQPPRENPWTETVERQPSARPEHDWNRRVARECYIPNGQARILDARGRIAALVNNYERLSFNFGPTLLAWFEKAYPRDYRRILDADQDSRRRLGGHGNAVAQAYNHMILPLAAPRDLDTQIRWGLGDFRRRFGRRPEAMWLPETACNEEVLKSLLEHGLKYAILAPGQALRVRPIGAPQWTDVSAGGLDPRRAYRWSAPGSQGRRRLALFFYDGGLSHGAAFGKAMSDAKAWADRIAAAFDPAGAQPQLVSICTDGESYGHHEHFGEMGLARLLYRELPERRIEVVNYGCYLAQNPPQWEAEIKPGPGGLGTSWSCSHGVARWTDACGCGAEGKQLDWRRPMREALDWLRDRLALVYEREGGRLFKDVWRARDAYIGVILDRCAESLARFMADQLKVPDAPETRAQALRLLEMQRHSLLMYTSCGWFFSDVSGIEAVQNLQYAARAVELAREAAGVDMEGELAARLKLAPSNYPERRDGEYVYRRLALAGRVGEDLAAAHYAVAMLFREPYQGWRLGHFQAVSSEAVRRPCAEGAGTGARLAAGRVELRSGVTGASFARVFLAAALPDCTIAAFVRRADLAREEYDALVERVAGLRDGAPVDTGALAGGLFPDPPYGFADLLADERERILKCIMDQRREPGEGMPILDLGGCISLAEQHTRLGLELPPALRGQAEAALDAWLHRRAREFRERPDGDLGDVSAAVVRARAAGLAAPSAAAEEAWERCFVMVLGGLEAEFGAAGLRRLAALARAATDMGLRRWRFRAQNRFFALLRRLPPQAGGPGAAGTFGQPFSAPGRGDGPGAVIPEGAGRSPLAGRGGGRARLAGEIDEAARLLDIATEV